MITLFSMIITPFRILRYYWKNYCLIVLQIAAGAAVIYSSITIYSSIQQRYDKMAGEIQEIEWSITASTWRETENVQPSYPLQYDQYQLLKQNNPGAQIPLYFIYKIFYPNEESELVNAYFLYASDDFIQRYITEDQSIEGSDTGYIGEEIRKVLHNQIGLLNVNPNTPTFHMENDKLMIDESTYVPMLPLEQLRDEKFTIKLINGNNSTQHIMSDQLVLLPLRWIYEQKNVDVLSAFRLYRRQ